MDRSPRLTRSIGVLVALVLLNAAVTFHNVWPTLGVHWPGECSVEVAALVTWLALSNSWLGRTGPRVLAALSALVVLFALGRYAEVTTPALYGREINLYWDGPRLVSVLQMLAHVASGWQLGAVCAGLLLVLYVLFVLAGWSVRQVDGCLRDSRPMRVGLGVAGGLLIASFLAQRLDARVPEVPRFSIPVTRTYGTQLARIVDALSSTRSARLLPPSPALRSNLQALEGSDVLIVFLESYGSVTYDRPEYERALEPARTRLAQSVHDTGRQAVSAFVVSPTFGGQSVLAHLSLLSSIEVRDSTRYALLMTQARPTLVSAFKQAGYRTVAIMPGMQQDWPEGSFYGFDEIYDAAKLRYRGPQFGWWRIPDQYSLAALDARELQPHPRKPLMLFFPTVSTHIPFRPVPPLQPDWQRMLSARPYDAAPLQQSFAQHTDWTAMGESYVSSVAYFLDVLSSYLRTHAREELVFVVLGDHQPAANVSGENAPWEVPVHIITRRADVLASLRRDGFRDGLTPLRPAIGKMNQLTPRLLSAFDGSDASRGSAESANR